MWGTDGQTMAWFMDTYSQLNGYTIPGVVTGKPISVGGSLGRAESTGKGVSYCVNFAADKLGMKINKKIKVAIHGFGKVGVPAALDLANRGATVVALGDVSGAVYCDKGINLQEAVDHVRKNRFLRGLSGCDAISNEELLTLDVDILVPAAIDGVVTAQNAHGVKAKIIAEGANGPLTRDAVNIIYQNGGLIIPDILCNAGGVIVSYFEWVQGLQNFFWGLDEINSKLHEILSKAFQEVALVADKNRVDMKQAAFVVALQRLEKAMRLKGAFSGVVVLELRKI